MYNNFRGMFVVKHRGGVIQYFKTGYDLFSLPRWDVRELGRLDMLNPDSTIIGADFERIIAKEFNKGFQVFKPQRPRRRVSKTTRDPITGKGKVTWVINPAKVVTRIMLPSEVPVCLNNFNKSFYDSQTGEAVIRSNTNEDIKMLDPMDVFMFGLSDLNVLNANRIHVGAGNANLEEATPFQRAVERAWKIKHDMLDIIDKIEKKKEAAEAKKKEEARKKKKLDKKKDKSPSKTRESSSTPHEEQQPLASSTYGATSEDPC
ncbi:hypothetical protein Hanom_Chr13g01219101 [Helianthus anomalus]